MIEILYTIFIYPIELLIKLILESAYQLTGSYGLSIVAVSIVISVLLYPIDCLIERLQEKERLKREAMKPQLEDLKQSFNGYELHLYVKQVYREHNYHPLSELKSSLGLLIQLPFLFAAYLFIANYEPLQGVSFSLISDLSEPDSLIQVASFSINFLPIMMTAVNIAGTYFYTKTSKIKLSLQLYTMSIVFLVLLYPAPSGLLIYWTCKNVFSFLKYLILYLRSLQTQ